MVYLLGTDEAGYGPNLGPLVVAATLWEVPNEPAELDLYERLQPTITAKPPKKKSASEALWLADSKVVYQGGIEALERGVAAAWLAAGWLPKPVADESALWSAICPDALPQWSPQPWQQTTAKWPTHQPWETLQTWANRLQAGLVQAGVKLVGHRTTALFPQEFNRRLEKYVSKGEVLSLATLELVRELLASIPEPGPVLIYSDKHGGRNKYAALLQHVFSTELVEILTERADLSLYRWGPRHARVEIRFQPRSERFLPVALASMMAKYLRELAMQSWNRYWQQLLPQLTPTAGYPEDALRFRQAIAELPEFRALPAEVYWRNK